MTSERSADSRKKRKPDPLAKFLSSLGVRRFAHLIDKTGLDEEKLIEWRDNPEKTIKYVDALRIAMASGGEISVDDMFNRTMPDKERFDNPLGRKIAVCLVNGPSLGVLLSKHGITHVEFSRWLTENIKWHRSTRQRISKAFSCPGNEITDEDFEEQKVDRLYRRYEEARIELEQRREKRKS